MGVEETQEEARIVSIPKLRGIACRMQQSDWEGDHEVSRRFARDSQASLLPLNKSNAFEEEGCMFLVSSPSRVPCADP